MIEDNLTVKALRELLEDYEDDEMVLVWQPDEEEYTTIGKSDVSIVHRVRRLGGSVTEIDAMSKEEIIRFLLLKFGDSVEEDVWVRLNPEMEKRFREFMKLEAGR